MIYKIRKKRFHLSHIAEQTRKALFFLLSFCATSLFIMHLFLMNHLSMRGYILTKETQTHQQLVLENEQLDAYIAKLQTQEFLTKTEAKSPLVFKSSQRFVIIPVRFTAQN